MHKESILKMNGPTIPNTFSNIASATKIYVGRKEKSLLQGGMTRENGLSVFTNGSLKAATK